VITQLTTLMGVDPENYGNVNDLVRSGIGLYIRCESCEAMIMMNFKDVVRKPTLAY
jgi:hypothetical protein